MDRGCQKAVHRKGAMYRTLWQRVSTKPWGHVIVVISSIVNKAAVGPCHEVPEADMSTLPAHNLLRFKWGGPAPRPQWSSTRKCSRACPKYGITPVARRRLS